MSHPLTLLQMAQAPLHPSPLGAAVLVVIDAQREYVEGKLPLTGVAPALAEIAALLDLARRQGMPVMHVFQHAPPGRGLFDPTGPFVAPAPQALPLAGEAIVTKRLPNAFAGTDLHQKIVDSGRREIVLAGFMTHMCVSATARAALDLGYRTSLVASATATRDLPDPVDGSVIPAAAVQRAALAAIADRFAIIVPDAAALVPASPA